MFCKFDLCEFYNVVFGGLLIGVITSFIFVWLTKKIEYYNFKRKYKHLQSSNKNFDWVAYSMKKSNGRIREDYPNGAKMHIIVKHGKIYLKLRQSDERLWTGELIIQQDNFGIVGLKYTDMHEYGRRECVIGKFVENGILFDFLFLTPLNGRIYYIDKQDDSKSIVHYNYDTEILIRQGGSAQ
ncbi:hypothetical protein EFY79_14060 [Hanamia caeni]|jgi:hypothetical protein|uniref:Uncharacterized protein n=1 Tax=Hanamia caeni TaxID=2294116 RepID=A0A3M9NAJ0_9BACT|nr:hypothetical protein [Hanamia caeni]RNI34809.1 hypothetical protein EFY79_14060 [Hanamia caeni]